MKILVTGGAGYIGSHAVVALSEAGLTPIIVDNFSNSDKGSLDGIAQIIGHEPKFYEGDCRDRDFLSNICEQEKSNGEPIAGVIHFAAFKAVGESVAKPLKYYDNNLNSLLSVLEVMDAQNIGALIFSSSATVYGDPAPVDLPLTEQTPRKPATNPYGATKAMCEDIIADTVTAQNALCANSDDTENSNQANLRKLSAVILRYFNPIGAHNSGFIGELPIGAPANLVPYLTQVAAGKRGALTVFGDDYPTPDGTGVRDYIHVMDLADAHIAALKFALAQNSNCAEIFNIGTGRGTSVKELIDTFQTATGITVPHTIGPRRAGDIATCYASVDKAHQILNWQAKHSLTQSLTDAWKWEQNCTKLSSLL